MTPALLVLGAYVLGATPTSYWVASWIYGIDLREEGSGNLGATNTLRVLGVRAAIPVMIIDILKGWLPVSLFPLLAGTGDPRWVLAYAGAAILGHVFSFWVRFRGGKGIATSAGALLGLAPLAVLLSLGVWLAVLALTRIVSLASLSSAVALPAGVLLFDHSGGEALLPFAAVLTTFAFWTHRANLGRLLRGEEQRISRGTVATSGDGVAPVVPGSGE